MASNNKNKNKSKTYTKNVGEPWFSLIKLGLKSVEGRLNKGEFSKFKKNDVVVWTNNDFGNLRSVKTKIKSIRKYKTFNDYLSKEGLENCLPGFENIKNGENVYYKYYSKENEEEFGILAIRLQIIK